MTKTLRILRDAALYSDVALYSIGAIIGYVLAEFVFVILRMHGVI